MKLDSIKKEAVERFRSGYSCSQSVLASMADELNIDVRILENVASGFGGGMGHMQETCGAVTGSFMAISLYCGSKYDDNNEKKEESYIMIREFNKRFISMHKTTCCKDLIKYDLESPEEHDRAVRENVFERVCESCIVDSLDILDQLINNNQKT